MSSRSFRDIYKKLRIELALSTAYHPQTDGQSKRTNQEVEQALRTIISFCENYAITTLFLPLFPLFILIPPVLSMTLNCIIMLSRQLGQYVERIHSQDTPILAIIRELVGPFTKVSHHKALRYQWTTIEDSGY